MMQNQLLFNLDVPPDKTNMTSRRQQLKPVIVEKADSEPTISDAFKLSNQFSNVPGKCHPFEFWKVSREKLNSAVQLAQHDLRRKKSMVPKNMLPRHMCSSASVACGDRQEVHNVVTRVAGTGLVNNTQRKHLKEHKIMKKVEESSAISTTTVGKCKSKKEEVCVAEEPIVDANPVPVCTASPPTRDKSGSNRHMEEVVSMCEEMDCCLTKIRQLQETAHHDPPRRFQVEELSQRQKRLTRIEEQKTRSTRILYTLSQKLREIDISLTKRPKPAKRNHLLQQLAAISRSSIRALNEFVQHLRDFNLAEGMPRIYDNLVVLLSQIIECFDRLNSNIVAETRPPQPEPECEEVPPPTKSVMIAHRSYYQQRKVPVPIVPRKKEKPVPIKKEPEDEGSHPLHRLRKKYPLGLPACVDIADEAPSEMTGYSLKPATSLVSSPALGRRSAPLIRTPSYQSCSQQSTHSCVNVLRNRSPSPLHMTEKLEELLHGNIDLPPPHSKRVERHVPWVVETMKHRRSHHSVSPQRREERRMSPEPRYADPTISSTKRASKLDSEPAPAKQKSTEVKGVSSSQEDERKIQPTKSMDMLKAGNSTSTGKLGHFEAAKTRNAITRQLVGMIDHDPSTKEKIKTLLESSKDQMDTDKLTEMILQQIMADTVQQLSAVMSDDDTDSVMSPPEGVTAEAILERLDTIEAEQNEIRQRWSSVQYKMEPSDETSAISEQSELTNVPNSLLPRPMRLTVGKSRSGVNSAIQSKGFQVKASRSTNSSLPSSGRSSPRHTSKVPRPGVKHYGQSVNNNNSRLVAIPMSESLVASIMSGQRQFQHYLRRSANMKVGRFDPWKVVDEVSEEILDTCLMEVCSELEQFNSDVANHIYSSEFASESSSEPPQRRESANHSTSSPERRQSANHSTSSPERKSTSSVGCGISATNSHPPSLLDRDWMVATGKGIKSLKV